MTHLLTALLALAAGWCWGHATARIRHIPIGALATDDETALDEAWIAERRAQFDDRLNTTPNHQEPRP
ncbi:hypothetical protein [Streptomyces sp. NBRC 110035]|uniref:hypothetical protein n=1 Tax=Streptomyces sp. NBRC 110035 TaxID=1547867 RepID=UPI0005A9BAA5|nr:hypothetical protein [Streptomyces sp. NBRC 110035]